MTAADTHEVPVDLRCTVVARGMGTPVGATAASFTAALLVEVPQPWPKSIEDHPLLDDLVPVAQDLGIRIQGIVPARDPEAPRDGGDAVKLVLYRRTGSGSGSSSAFTGFERVEATAPVDVLPNTVRGLWDNTAPTDRTEVLVCAHGKRDRCCGSLGTVSATHAVANGIAALRTSHLGGHRFAPTALVLPEGTAWAWLDDDLLQSIVSRSIGPTELRDHYRGSAGIDHPAAQLVEAEAFFETGWSWLDRARAAEVAPDGDDRWRASVTDGTTTWSATVVHTGRLPQPVCGQPIDEATKHDDVLEIVELTRSRGPGS